MTTADMALTGQQAKARENGFPWLALFPLALIPVFGTSPGGLQAILLLIQGSFLILGIRRPVWILAALMVSELTIANYMWEFGGSRISNRLILTLASIPLVMPHVVQRPDLGPRTRSMAIVAVVFVLLATVADLAAGDAASVLKFTRYLITGLIALLLAPAAVNSRDDVRDLSLAVLVVSATSALVAVLQHYSQFTDAPLYQAIPHPGLGPDTFDTWGGRAVGLAENPIYVTGTLLFSAMFLLGVILLGNLNPRVRLLFTAILLMTVAALFFSYTRSWVYAAAVGLFAILMLYRGRYSRELLLLMILVGGAFFYWSDFQNNRYTQTASTDSSAATRPVLWDAGLQIALDHPILGVGHGRFKEISPQYASRIDRSLLERQEAGTALGTFEPHNDFLNIWLSWGTGAILLYLGLLAMTVKNYLEVFLRTDEPLLKGLALGGIGAVFALAGNSFFHNLFDSTLTMWLLAGLSLALTKVMLAKPPRRRRPRMYT
jgi:O-antigen ligase